MPDARTMITFAENGTRFTYRIGGIAIHDNRVLFQRAEEAEPFWFLPGGRAELGESAMETLKREMREELGVEVTIERLLYIVENFYQFSDSAASHHELGLYFLMTFPPDAYLYQLSGPFLREDNGMPITFAWLQLDKLAQLPIYPTVFQEVLQVIPTSTMHIVHIDK
jgi:ADP-ribose pyrophosphatase YjhB (NUDIX family)